MRRFDTDTVWRLAIERQKAGKGLAGARGSAEPARGGPDCRRARRRARSPAWFAAGRVSHAEIVLLSGKTHETIRYLYAQYITPSGARLRMTARAPVDAIPESPAYFPELEPATRASRPQRLAPRPEPVDPGVASRGRPERLVARCRRTASLAVGGPHRRPHLAGP